MTQLISSLMNMQNAGSCVYSNNMDPPVIENPYITVKA